MTDHKKPRTNPLTGTVVIEPPASQPPPVTKPLPKPPAPQAGGRHPLDGTVLLPDAAGAIAFPKALDPEAPPATQAIPMRLNGPAVPFAKGHPQPESERTSQLPSRAPWSEVRRDVQPAQHALAGTLVDPEPSVPSQSKSAQQQSPGAAQAEAPQSSRVAAARPQSSPAIEGPESRRMAMLPQTKSAPDGEPPALPEDPWGTQLKDVEPPRANGPAPAPAPKLPERQEIKKGLYSRFFKGKG